MDFWGAKVSGLKTVACPVGHNNYLHVSNAALESGTGRVVLRLKSDGKEFILGTLESGKCDQLSLDLILSKPFHLAHNSKTATVHVTGYKTEAPSDEEEALERKPALVGKENGKINASDTSDESDTDDEDEDEEDSDSDSSEDDDDMNIPIKPSLGDSLGDTDSEDDSDDEEMNMHNKPSLDMDTDEDEDDSDESDDEDDEDDEDDDEDDEEENVVVLPKKNLEEKPKLPQGKKRPAEAETPSSDKKTKKSRPDLVLSAKSEKPAPKTPKSSEKDKEKKAKTPTSNAKSPGQHRCVTCSRDFANELALTQHNTAKHKH